MQGKVTWAENNMNCSFELNSIFSRGLIRSVNIFYFPINNLFKMRKISDVAHF